MTEIRRSLPSLSGATWRTSSHSGGNNECVEVAASMPGVVAVRDSKRPSGRVLEFRRQAWEAFLGRLD